jgi:hypothetical protein
MGRQKETEDDYGGWAVMRKAEASKNKNTRKREIIITKMKKKRTEGNKTEFPMPRYYIKRKEKKCI